LVENIVKIGKVGIIGCGRMRKIENKKFEKWLEKMVETEWEDDYLVAGTIVEKGEVDLQLAFEAGQNEMLAEVSRMVKKFRKDDEEVLKEEPCCKVNVKGEKYYCQFHALLDELERWIRRNQPKDL
jgi:hypothetical protein